MTPAETLRAAAAKLRDTARHAAPAPWSCSPVWSPDSKSTSGVYSHHYPTGTVDSEVVASGRIKSGYGGIRNPHNALWIALMSPALAEPLAALLEAVATDVIGNWHPGNECCDLPLAIAGQVGDGVNTCRCPDVHSALAVARAVLGEAS